MSMNKNIRLIVLLSLLFCMVILMGCPPQSIDIPVSTKLTVSPSVSTSSSVIPVLSGAVTPVPTQSVNSTTNPTTLPVVTEIPIQLPTITPYPTPTPTPSSTPFGTPTPEPTEPNEGGFSSGCGGCTCNSPNLLPNVVSVSSVDIFTEPLFVSYKITGSNFYVGSITVNSIFYTSPTTLNEADQTTGDTRTVERNQSQNIIEQSTENFIDNGTATASFVSSNVIKVKIPKSVFDSNFDFSNIKVISRIRYNSNYSLPEGNYNGHFPVPIVDNVSLPTVDYTFVMYTITGTNFFVGSTTVSSLYYTPPATLATAGAAGSDTLTIEKLQSQGITVQTAEILTDTGAATVSLVDSTHMKVKIPKSVFTSGFDFTQIRVGSILQNPSTQQVGPIGGGGLIN